MRRITCTKTQTMCLLEHEQCVHFWRIYDFLGIVHLRTCFSFKFKKLKNFLFSRYFLNFFSWIFLTKFLLLNYQLTQVVIYMNFTRICFNSKLTKKSSIVVEKIIQPTLIFIISQMKRN